MGFLERFLFQRNRKTRNLKSLTFEKVGDGFFEKLFSKKYIVVAVNGNSYLSSSREGIRIYKSNSAREYRERVFDEKEIRDSQNFFERFTLLKKENKLEAETQGYYLRDDLNPQPRIYSGAKDGDYESWKVDKFGERIVKRCQEKNNQGENCERWMANFYDSHQWYERWAARRGVELRWGEKWGNSFDLAA